MRLTRRALVGSSLGALAAACATQTPASEDVVLRGRIYTGLADTPHVESIRIRNRRVTYIGAYVGDRGARVIDLNGATAFPGFTDAHVHLISVGLQRAVLDLVGVPSLATMQQQLADYARGRPSGPIIGRGWIETHWPEKRFPTRADLDAIVSDRPVLLTRIDGHAAVANSAALNLARIDNTTPDPPGGRIERDASGAATGMLIDSAAEQAEARFPQPTRADKRAALLDAAKHYASRGWTGVHVMGSGPEEVSLYEEVAAAGELPLKVDVYMSAEHAPLMYARGPYAHASGRVHVRGVKLYMDGALGSRGAALLAPYSDAPGDGLLLTEPETLRVLLEGARVANAQVATHAIGDRGNRLVLDAYRAAFADDPAALRAARWRIEHAQVIDPVDIPRFGAQGVIASMQPSHAISDLHFAPARLGPNRLGGAYAWRALLDTHAVIAAGSDAPVEKGDPLIEFYAAAYRHDLTGFAGPDWHLDQAVSRGEALAMLTHAPAFATFSENEQGTLAPGMRANVSVFSEDLMSAEFSRLPTAKAALTISDGLITHDAL